MRPVTRILQRAFLLVAMGLCAVNIWTGGPLAAMWIGARVQGDAGGLKMVSVFAVIVALAVICAGLVNLLGRLGAQYDHVTGRAAGPRRQAPWMRSMRGERPKELQDTRRPTAMEWILVGAVVLAVVAMEFWFFFLSGSSIGH
jgi:hypothetical protein